MIANQLHPYDFSKPSGLACDSADQLSLWIANCCSLMKEMWSDLANTPRSFHAKFSEAVTFQKVREKLAHTAIADQVRDIRVVVTAEIGNVSLPIGQILELGEGSVIELDLPINNARKPNMRHD